MLAVMLIAFPFAIVHPPVEAKFPAPPYAGFIISPSSKIRFYWQDLALKTD